MQQIKHLLKNALACCMFLTIFWSTAMFPAAAKATNGLTVQYIDGGVTYSLGNSTFTLTGEWQFGEVEVNGKVIGDYSVVNDTIRITTFDGEHTVVLGNGEKEFENFVLQTLQVAQEASTV